MSEEAARSRIEAWLAPIPGASPAGEDARYEPLHEQIRAEAAKLENPAGGPPDWAQLVKQAEQLTTQRSKDLLIESYAAYGLFQTEGLMGLASGVFLLAESMDRYWEAMHPPAKRLRARVNAIQWLTDRLDATLPEARVGPGDYAAVQALDAAIKRLRSVVADKFEDQAPALRPLAEAVERLKLSLPEGSAPAPADAAPPSAQAPTAQPSVAGASVARSSVAEPSAAAAPPEPAAPAAEPPPAEPAAPPPAARDLAAELAEAAKRWTEPIPGGSPAGIDAKFDPEHEALRNDIAALDSPSGGNVDWPKVVPRAGTILAEKSKDLLIATYLAYALWETERLKGLAIGLEVLSQLCERYWENAFPPVARIRGRANALAWLLARLEHGLGAFAPTAKDKDDVELLEASAKRFASVVRDKFEDAAPPVRPLVETVQRIKMSVPEQPAPPPPPPPPPAAPAPALKPAAPAATAPAPSPAAAAPISLDPGGATLADPAEVGKFTNAVAKTLIDASKIVRAAAPQDPIGYTLLRAALALTAKLPPITNGATTIPAPPDALVRELATHQERGNWDRLLLTCEVSLVGKRFWLDLHRLSALALTNLGKDFEAARDTVVAWTALWVKLYPAVIDATFAGGMPFASDVTKEWLAAEVMPSAGGGGGGGSETTEGSEAIAAARALLAGGKTEEALSALAELAGSAKSGRARFRARLAIAQALASGPSANIAEGMFEALSEELVQRGLETWEPELAAECYRAHLICLKQLRKPNDSSLAPQIAAVSRRLSRVDPLAALKLGI